MENLGWDVEVQSFTNNNNVLKRPIQFNNIIATLDANVSNLKHIVREHEPSPLKITPHQVFGDLGSIWSPDEDPGRCRAGTPWHFALFAKIQYGRRSPGMVTPTFFLWEINQKFFFLL